MDSENLLRAGKLSEARRQTIEKVKANPCDLSNRFLLFHILAFLGEWDKAEKHLDAMVAQTPSYEIGIEIFKSLITAERQRQRLWLDGGVPGFLPEAPSWLQHYLDARQALRGGRTEDAKRIFTDITETLLPVCGKFRNEDFIGFYDTDSSLAFFVEAFVFDKYVWIPVSQLRELSVDAPKKLSDLLWASAHLTTWEGLTLNCRLPVLYPGSYQHPDDRVKLGRMTDWNDLGNGLVRGVGQHVFALGEKDVAILELGEVIWQR